MFFYVECFFHLGGFMRETEREVLRFVEENDVKFIRLAFSDLEGTQKNMSIMPCELEKAFSKGIPFDTSKFQGFFHKKAFLRPIANTLSLLPWRPQSGRVIRLYCDIVDENGRHMEYDSRDILSQTIEKGKKKGYEFQIGVECEFYLFKNDAYGHETTEPIDHGSYFDIAPLDQAENIRRDICLTLEKMSIQPLSSHHEAGWGQNEIVFAENEPLCACDNIMTYKSVVATMASLSGYSASFHPLPIKDQPGSGLHFRIAIQKNDVLLDEHDEAMKQFKERIQKRLPEICAILDTKEESYERVNRLDPKRLIEIDKEWLIVHSADSLCNPYLALACMLEAGMCEETSCEKLPTNLEKARKIAQHSSFLSSFLNENILKVYSQ